VDYIIYLAFQTAIINGIILCNCTILECIYHQYIYIRSLEPVEPLKFMGRWGCNIERRSPEANCL
jgi:hypothetical protein